MARVLADRAMCVDMSASIFDAVIGPDVDEALKACRVCPVVVECELFVRPKKSFFDGVCGGKVWVDGVVIDPSQTLLAFDLVNWGDDDPSPNVRDIAPRVV